MELVWLDPEHPDEQDVAGAVAALEAARAVDTPQRATPTVSWLTARLRHGGDGLPPAVAVARTRVHGDRVLGVLRLHLPRWANTHLADVHVTVDPRGRRQGLGRALFEAGAARARQEGRSLLCATCLDQPGPVAFLTAMGLRPAFTEVLSSQQVAEVDWESLGAQEAAARSAAADYDLLRLPGPLPEDLLDPVAALTASMNDAPTGELDIEDEKYPPERIRAYERAAAGRRGRLYRVLARHRASGDLAGQTVVEVDGERPWQADQAITSVVRVHRGRRLGLLMKIEMLRWLAEVEPQVREIDTGNAADNAHMIRVNETLGYQPYGTKLEFQRHL